MIRRRVDARFWVVVVTGTLFGLLLGVELAAKGARAERTTAGAAAPLPLTDNPQQAQPVAPPASTPKERSRPGVYSRQLRRYPYLTTVTLTGRPTTLQELGTMRAGDVNDDNLVDSTDFTLLRARFGQACGSPTYDSRADFSSDCLVDITDFTLQRGNFGQSGAPP